MSKPRNTVNPLLSGSPCGTRSTRQRASITWAAFLTCTAAGLLVVAAARTAAAKPLCGGDCDGDGRVVVSELVTAVGVLVHDEPVARCTAADVNENGALAVNEVIVGVSNSLAGCPSARADALVTAFIGDDTPGMAVMVIDHGQVVHRRAYGLADVAGGVPITTSTTFYIASVTKSFTALSVLMLAERGRLALDDPVSRYLPELARFGDAVTIRRLLAHTSGIPDYFSADPEIYARWLGLDPAIVAQAIALLPPAPDTDPALYGDLLRAGRPVASLGLAAVLEAYGDLLFAPGDAAAYSNTGYDLLGGVIERVSGQRFDAFVRDNILVPLAMTQSFVLPGAGRLADPDVAKGYGRKGDTLVPYEIPPWHVGTGSGDIFTTLDDLYRYDQALYGDSLVSQASLAEAFTPQKLNDGSDATDPFGKIGLGWLLSEIDGERAVFHPGLYYGFVSNFVRFVDRELTFIILSNREDQIVENFVLTYQLADIYLHPPGVDR